MRSDEHPDARDLTTNEAARLLDVDDATLRRWARLGLVPARRLPGRRGAFRFNRADLLLVFRPGRDRTEARP